MAKEQAPLFVRNGVTWSFAVASGFVLCRAFYLLVFYKLVISHSFLRMPGLLTTTIELAAITDCEVVGYAAGQGFNSYLRLQLKDGRLIEGAGYVDQAALEQTCELVRRRVK